MAWTARLRHLSLATRARLACAVSLYYFLVLAVSDFSRSGPARPWCSQRWFHVDCWSPASIRRERLNGTDLKVVLPSYGQTGTTSVVEALRQMGLRTYHADDFSTSAKWIMRDHVSPERWSSQVTRCGMDAISLEPVTDLLPLAISLAPRAKFILTWRPFPQWRRSSGGSRAKEYWISLLTQKLGKGNAVFPWVEVIDGLTGAFLQTRLEGDPFAGDFASRAYLYRVVCNGYAWPDNDHINRGTFKGAASEEGYLGHVNEIRTHVPEGRLFEFDVSKHSWGELEEIVWGNRSSIQRGKFPQPRSKKGRTNEPLLEKHWDKTGPAYFSLAVMHSLNFFAVSLLAGILASL